jgi:hypothetical protein
MHSTGTITRERPLRQTALNSCAGYNTGQNAQGGSLRYGLRRSADFCSNLVIWSILLAHVSSSWSRPEARGAAHLVGKKQVIGVGQSDEYAANSTDTRMVPISPYSR